MNLSTSNIVHLFFAYYHPFYRKADIGWAGIKVKADRHFVVDFSVPIISERYGLSILLKKFPKMYSIWSFIWVAENKVWYAIVGSYFIASVLIWFFER